jgi:hypothetical protein
MTTGSGFRQPFGKQLIAGDDWSWRITLHRYPPTAYTLKYFFRGNCENATLNVVATIDEDGQQYDLAVPNSLTESLPPGVYAWQMCVFATDGAGAWQAATNYEVGDMVYDGECLQECTTPGTSGSEPPTWVETLNGTTDDGTDGPVWTCQGKPARTELDRGDVAVIPDISAQTAPYDGRSWPVRMLQAVECVLEGRATRVERQYAIAGRELQLMSKDELMSWRGELKNLVKRELIDSGQDDGRGSHVLAGFDRGAIGPGVWNK